MNKLTSFLDHLTIGTPQTHGNLKVYPLHRQNGHERQYRTLDEAMQEKVIDVTEVSEGGSVPSLKVHNSGKLPVLLIIGEELIGAKQNRVLNTSLLVPAESDLIIPVSCVEQGRWAYSSRKFESSSTSSSHFALRMAQTEQVTRSLKSRATYAADQGEIWDEVGRKVSSHRATSPTHALKDVYDQSEKQLKEYLEAFTPPEDAEGILVEIGDQVVGADVFDHADTLRTLWPKLVRSYALDALERRGQKTEPAKTKDTQQFLVSVREAEDETFDSVGLGQDVRLSSKAITGSGLLWEDQLIHASLFNTKAQPA